jgi:uncharacterized protein YdeI (YjbR/CyaY-like superfamily)
MAKSFRSREDFRAWLERHHASKSELMIRLFKVHASHRGIGYREALDEALCYGWIDGVRRSLDEDSFTQRFTPRKARSNWSSVNIKRVNELIAEGRMHPAGLKAFEARDKTAIAPYSFEHPFQQLSPGFEKRLKAKKKAWTYWEKMPPGQRRITTHWVMSARREETREKRFAILLASCAEQLPIPALRR